MTFIRLATELSTVGLNKKKSFLLETIQPICSLVFACQFSQYWSWISTFNQEDPSLSNLKNYIRFVQKMHLTFRARKHPSLFYHQMGRVTVQRITTMAVYVKNTNNLTLRHRKVGRALFILRFYFKAHSHLLQRSADSAVDCINAEIGIFLSLQSNATVCCRHMWKTR